MASIHKHPRSRYWQAAYRDAEGRRAYRSTKKTSRSDALRIALAFEEAAKKARSGLLTESVMRSIITESVLKTGGDPIQSHEIAQWCRAWIADKRLSRAPGTAVRYGPIIEDFLKHLGPKATRDISHLSKIDVQTFRDRKIKTGLSGDSVNTAIKTLRACFRVAVRQGLITANPAEAIDLLPSNPRVKEAFNRKQVRELIQAATDPEWKGLIKVGYYIGARLGDCATLRFENIDFEARLLTYVPTKQPRGKKPRSLQVPIHPELMAYLQACRKASGPIFPRLSATRISGVAGLSLAFRALMNKAGINCAVYKPQGNRGRRVYSLSFHSLRRAFNTDLANSDVSQEIRQRLIGHLSEEVNDRYTTIEMGTFQNAIDRLPYLELGSAPPKTGSTTESPKLAIAHIPESSQHDFPPSNT